MRSTPRSPVAATTHAIQLPEPADSGFERFRWLEHPERLQPAAVSCPVCESKWTHLFFTQNGVPTQAGYLAPTREKALQATLGEITLHHCRSCAHIWNSSFDPAKLGFDADYDFSQYHSAAYRDYIAKSLGRLNQRYGFDGKTALDIACGKGDYLRMLVASGVTRAVGFDPTFVDSGFSDEDRERITVYQKYYGPEDAAIRPDFVTCRSALQYIPKPRDLLGSIRRTLEGQYDTVTYFEVPNGSEAFKEKIVWYVMYEAGCFFSPTSLARIFRECGFHVLDIIPALGSSQLEIEARPSRAPGVHPAESAGAIAEIDAQVADFAEEYAKQVTKWTARFHSYQNRGRKVAMWGAGMRAISLLVNVPSASETVEFVTDVNPHRQGRYLPKTGQKVVSPEELARMKPDVVIATNPNYADEIADQIHQLGMNCEFDVLR